MDVRIALLTFAPVLLVLALLTFGRYGTREGLAPTPARMAWVAVASAVLGPVAVAMLGLFGWLVLVVALVTGLAMFAAWREPREPVGG